MTIDDMLCLCMEDEMIEVEIYRIEKQKTVWQGRGRSAVPDKYRYEEVCSWDLPTTPGHITINIE